MLRRWSWIAAVMAVGCGVQGGSQQEAVTEAARPPPEEARQLTEEVTQLNARLLDTGLLEPQPLLAQRATALERLVALDAQAALGLALPEPVRAELARRHPELAELLESRGTWKGELEVVVVDSPTLQEVRTDLFLTVDDEQVQVHFTGPAAQDLQSGQMLEARGYRMGRRLAVESARPLARMSSLSASTAPACTSIGEQRSITLLVTFPGVPQPSLTVPQVEEVLFSTTQRSLTRFYGEVSNGRTSMSGDVKGWYVLDRDYTCAEYNQMRTAAIRAADPEVDFSQYNRIHIVHPTTPAGCDYGGLGTLACSTLTTADGPVVASTAWLRSEYMTPNDRGVELASHEGGHNLSLHHASSRDFGTEALGPVGAMGTLSEYGDLFSTMGSWNLGTYAAPHKAKLGWMDPGAVLELDAVDATVTLAPYGLPGGVQALKIRRGYHGQGWLWLESRAAQGDYDITLPTNAFAGVLVHYEDSVTWSGRTHLLDFTPHTASWLDPVLLPGTTWSDPYTNLELTVSPDTSAGLTVDVRYAPVPCVPAPPEVELFVYSEWTAPGWDAEGEVLVRNRDTLGCPVSTFQVDTVYPEGWFLWGDLLTELQLAPGSSGYITLPLGVADDAAPGEYPIQATVTRDGQSVTVSNSYTVVEPCTPAPVQVTLDPPSASIAAGATASFTVTVHNPEPLACGYRWLKLESTALEGWTNTLSATSLTMAPGETHTVTLTKGAPSTASGTYPVDVRVLVGTQVNASASGTITVIPCQPAAPVLSLTPSTASVLPGQTASLTLSLQNADSAACAASTFNLARVLPAGWQGTLSTASRTLAPGASATATLTLTPPTSTAAGSHPVSVSASRAGASGATASATINVLLPPLQATLTTTTPEVKRRSSVPFTANVLRSNGPVAQASVRITVTKPNGTTASATVSTDAQGRATWSYVTDVKGTHTARAVVTADGQSVTTSSVSFSVK